MRHTHYFSRSSIIVFSFCALLLVACESSGGIIGEPKATSINTFPAYLSFDGTSSATFEVTSNGQWGLVSDASWLEFDKTSGSTGTTTVSVTVDRGGLSPQQYASEVTLYGSSELASVTVSMRFPTVSGDITNGEGLVTVGLRESGRGLAVADSTAFAAVIPGEYLVWLNDGMARALEARSSMTVLQSREPSLATFEAMGAGLAVDYGLAAEGVISRELSVLVVHAASEEDAARLAVDGRVRSISPNLWMQAPPVTLTPADVDYSFNFQWHYEDIRLSNAWNITRGDSDVVVAVIDTGFAYWHPDLATNFAGGYNFVNDVADPGAHSECTLHGTHVAGTVAGAVSTLLPDTSGVAPGVKLQLVRAGVDGPDCLMPLDAVISGVLYAAGYKVGNAPQIAPVDVINMSLGSSLYSEPFEAAIALAIDSGVVVVAATGNDNTTPVMYPARYPGVIGVGATDYLEQRAFYSNYGQNVDVVAPGGDMSVDHNGDGFPDGVLSLYWDLGSDFADYTFLQGTSMASPHVAGIVALMRSVNPDLSPLNVELILEDSAKDLGIIGGDTWYGWGLVDAGSAVAVARALEAAPSFSNVIVRLRSGSTVLGQVNAGDSGSFNFGQVAAGYYTLEAGTDLDGDGSIVDFGEFYASAPITVSYSGDVVRGLEVRLD